MNPELCPECADKDDGEIDGEIDLRDDEYCFGQQMNLFKE